MNEPKVLLADEPTASLDDDAAAEAVKLLHTTALAYGASLVIATHDARVAQRQLAEIEGQHESEELQKQTRAILGRPVASLAAS